MPRPQARSSAPISGEAVPAHRTGKVGTALPGWLVVLPRRHVRRLDELTEAEASELGPLLRVVTAALREATGCQKTYVALFAEAEGFGHVHFHVSPRQAGLDPALRGPRVFALMGGDASRHVTLTAPYADLAIGRVVSGGQVLSWLVSQSGSNVPVSARLASRNASGSARHAVGSTVVSSPDRWWSWRAARCQARANGRAASRCRDRLHSSWPCRNSTSAATLEARSAARMFASWYSGTAGRVENCQVAVFLSYATRSGRH